MDIGILPPENTQPHAFKCASVIHLLVCFNVLLLLLLLTLPPPPPLPLPPSPIMNVTTNNSTPFTTIVCLTSSFFFFLIFFPTLHQKLFYILSFSPVNINCHCSSIMYFFSDISYYYYGVGRGYRYIWNMAAAAMRKRHAFHIHTVI